MKETATDTLVLLPFYNFLLSGFPFFLSICKHKAKTEMA